MNKDQNYIIRQPQNETNRFIARNQIKDLLEEPRTPIPDESFVPEHPDENPNPTGPEPGIDEPEINDPTRIDEPPEIFNIVGSYTGS